MTTALEDISARIALINADVTGVKRAYEHPPVQVNTADLPCMAARFQGVPGDLAIGDVGATFYDWELWVVGKPLAQGLDPSDHVDALLPFVSAVRDEYASRMHLNTDAGVSLLSGIVSVAGMGNVRNEPVQIGDTWYPCFKFQLRIKHIESVTVGGCPPPEMKVYLLMQSSVFSDGLDIDGVFATREAAQRYVEDCARKRGGGVLTSKAAQRVIDAYDIEEWDVQD